jgi:hypothetical protein
MLAALKLWYPLGEISGSYGGEYEDVLWDVAPCSLVGGQGDDYKVQHPRRQ